MKITVFYSWQSDLPNLTNRSFIEKALENATKLIREDQSLQVEPVVDRNTDGVPGAPDIASTILDKIDQASIFVCDISIINKGDNTRQTPNPNVLIELGFAAKALGMDRVILVMNTAYGDPKSLPFDLRNRRVITYSTTEADQDRATERKKLEGLLRHSLGIILSELNTSFELDEHISKLIMEFRTARLVKIRAGDSPVKLPDGRCIVLHTMPARAFSQSDQIDLSTIEQDSELQKLTYSWIWGRDRRYNDDGLVFFSGSQQWQLKEKVEGYLQIFRDGNIESVQILKEPTSNLEIFVFDSLINILRVYKRLGVNPPLKIALDLLRTKGWRVIPYKPLAPVQTIYNTNPLTNDEYILPEQISTDFRIRGDALMKPVFDRIWSACGWPKSLDYDAYGKWQPWQEAKLQWPFP